MKGGLADVRDWRKAKGEAVTSSLVAGDVPCAPTTPQPVEVWRITPWTR